jgi:hypothetical protein
MKRIWHNYSLSIVIGTAFLAAWLGHLIGEWAIANLYPPHGEPWALAWFTRMIEAWQGELMGVIALIWASAHFYHKGSMESKDRDEAQDAKIDAIMGHLGVGQPQEEVNG